MRSYLYVAGLSFMFYINWYPGTPTNLKRSASGGEANEGSPPKRPREECELRFTCIPFHNPVLFSCLCTNFALANPTIYSLYSWNLVGHLVASPRNSDPLINIYIPSFKKLVIVVLLVIGLVLVNAQFNSW